MNYSIEENEGNYRNVVIHLELDYFRSINHVLLTTLGVPLNLLIVIVILTNQRLKKKPRNIIFLGASLSAVFTLLTILVELLAYHGQSFFLCNIFGLTTKVAYSCLLYNLALALLDRFFCHSLSTYSPKDCYCEIHSNHTNHRSCCHLLPLQMAICVWCCSFSV